MKTFLLSLLISTFAFADTPSPGVVGLKGATDGTKIGNVADALKVNVTNGGGSSTVNQGTPNGGGANAWYVQGSLGKTWDLTSGADSVTSFQGGTWNVTVSNPNTNYALETGGNLANIYARLGTINTTLGSPFQAGGSIGNTVFGATQSGAWTTGRTWSLLNTTDSVNVGNFPSTFGVTQSTSPWVVSGTVTATPSGNYTVVQPTGSNLHADIDNFPSTFGVTQSTSPWVVSGTVTSNIGTTNGLALDTSVNSLLKPASTLAAVTSITNPVTVAQATAANFNATAVTTGGVTIAKDSSVTGLQVAQGSTTSGENGTLIQGAVTTNQPSYSTSQTSPISLTLRGATRTKQVGLDTVTLIRNVYSSTNVTTAAYVQLVASTSLEINSLYIFDSSGQDFTLAVGGAGSEVDQIQISPGGWNMPIQLYIPSGSRISIKAQSATANSGILLITGLK